MRSAICISSSTSEVSQLVFGFSGSFLLTWCLKELSGDLHSCECILNKVQPVIGLGFHPSSIKGVDQDALWLTLLNEVRPPTTQALNCSVSDCDGAERTETVAGQVCERVRLQSDRSDMTPNTLLRSKRTCIATRFTEETSVTSCGWLWACRSSLPRTRCQL